MSKNPDQIAAIEKAISEKYGEEAVQNPRGNWTETKEKNYLEQSKDFYKKQYKIDEWQEKVDVNGIKISKKSMDDVCLVKFDCCNACYIQYVENREERWLKGWRPKNGNSL